MAANNSISCSTHWKNDFKLSDQGQNLHYRHQTAKKTTTRHQRQEDNEILLLVAMPVEREKDDKEQRKAKPSSFVGFRDCVSWASVVFLSHENNGKRMERTYSKLSSDNTTNCSDEDENVEKTVLTCSDRRCQRMESGIITPWLSSLSGLDETERTLKLQSSKQVTASQAIGSSPIVDSELPTCRTPSEGSSDHFHSAHVAFPASTLHNEIANYVESGKQINNHPTPRFLQTTKIATEAAWKLCWQRIGCLGFFLVSLSVTAVVMRDFEDALEAQVQLAYFVPLLAGHGGNTGGQAVSTILAALSADLITLQDAPRLIFKEALSGFLIGALLGSIIGPVSYFILSISGPVSTVVALTFPLVSSMASTLGAALPFACLGVGWDPNIIAAPAMTSVVDVCGILCYFVMAKHVFSMLGMSL